MATDHLKTAGHCTRREFRGEGAKLINGMVLMRLFFSAVSRLLERMPPGIRWSATVGSAERLGSLGWCLVGWVLFGWVLLRLFFGLFLGWWRGCR